jgi:hypothetical protein
MSKLKKLGEVSVDSGQVIVVDPCYLHDWKHGKFDPAAKGEPENHYDETCRVTCGDEGGGPVFNHLAVATGSGYGDGGYSAHVLVAHKRHVALVVLFDENADTLYDLADQIEQLAHKAEEVDEPDEEGEEEDED